MKKSFTRHLGRKTVQALSDVDMIKLRDLFHKYDLDGSMTIGLDELENIIAEWKQDQNLSKPELEAMAKDYMEKLDVDGSGEISFSEFVSGFEQLFRGTDTKSGSKRPVINRTSFVAIQRKTFTNWVNAKVKHQLSAPLNDVIEDLGDGEWLVYLVESLLGVKIPLSKSKMQKFRLSENMESVLSVYKNQGLKFTITSSDFVNHEGGDGKQILGFLFSLVRKYGNSPENILEFINQILELQNMPKIDNLDPANFMDGIIFCAISLLAAPSAYDFSSLSPTTAKDNLSVAFDVAEFELGVPRLLEISDILSGNIDQESIVTYLSEFDLEGIVSGVIRVTDTNRKYNSEGVIEEEIKEDENNNLSLKKFGSVNKFQWDRIEKKGVDVDDKSDRPKIPKVWRKEKSEMVFSSVTKDEKKESEKKHKEQEIKEIREKEREKEKEKEESESREKMQRKELKKLEKEKELREKEESERVRKEEKERKKLQKEIALKEKMQRKELKKLQREKAEEENRLKLLEKEKRKHEKRERQEREEKERQRVIEEKEDEIKRLQTLVKQLRQENLDKTEQISLLKKDGNTKATDYIDKYEKTNLELQTANSNLEKANTNLEKMSKKLTETESELQRLTQEKKEKIAEMKDKIDTLEHSLSNSELDVKKLEEKLDDSQEDYLRQKKYYKHLVKTHLPAVHKVKIVPSDKMSYTRK